MQARLVEDEHLRARWLSEMEEAGKVGNREMRDSGEFGGSSHPGGASIGELSDWTDGQGQSPL